MKSFGVIINIPLNICLNMDSHSLLPPPHFLAKFMYTNEEIDIFYSNELD